MADDAPGAVGAGGVGGGVLGGGRGGAVAGEDAVEVGADLGSRVGRDGEAGRRELGGVLGGDDGDGVYAVERDRDSSGTRLAFLMRKSDDRAGNLKIS